MRKTAPQRKRKEIVKNKSMSKAAVNAMHMMAAEIDMHKAGNEFVFVRVFIEFGSMNQSGKRRCRRRYANANFRARVLIIARMVAFLVRSLGVNQ